jgi:hypothetical protein
VLLHYFLPGRSGVEVLEELTALIPCLAPATSVKGNPA